MGMYDFKLFKTNKNQNDWFTLSEKLIATDEIGLLNNKSIRKLSLTTPNTLNKIS